MFMIKSHNDLQLWKDSIQLVKRTYIITSYFPDEEKFGLVSQMRRSAISSNLADGFGRDHLKN